MDPLYNVAKQICHEEGIDYRHPVTGKVYPAPKPVEHKREGDPVRVAYVPPRR